MDATLVYVLLVGGPFAFGLGAAVTMDRAFGFLNPIGKPKVFRAILGWFFGNGALVILTLTSTNLAAQLGIGTADGIAVLSYLFGFGIGITALGIGRWIAKWAADRKGNPLIHVLAEHLGRREIDLLLLVLNGGQEVLEASSKLAIPIEAAPKIYSEALKKLQKLGVELFKELAEQGDLDENP